MNNTIIDITQIMKLIPHRHPFLLVDKIVQFQPNSSITGVKNVTYNEQFFIGHFPSRPVMPGVLIVEALAQTSAILVAKSMASTEDKEVYFMAIENMKFRKVVIPGDTLYLNCQIRQQRSNVWKFTGKAKVMNEVVTEGEFSAMVKIKDS